MHWVRFETKVYNICSCSIGASTTLFAVYAASIFHVSNHVISFAFFWLIFLCSCSLWMRFSFHGDSAWFSRAFFASFHLTANIWMFEMSLCCSLETYHSNIIPYRCQFLDKKCIFLSPWSKQTYIHTDWPWKCVCGVVFALFCHVL